MNTLKINQMGDNHSTGVIPFLLSTLLTFVTAITAKDVSTIVTIIGGISATGCGLWGWYSHHLNIKIKKEELKKLQNKN